MPEKVINIGKSARLDAMVKALSGHPFSADVYVISDIYNGRLASPDHLFVGKSNDKTFVRECIEKVRPDLAIIGPEEPLACGIVDMLLEMGVPCVGPTKSLAYLETSKAFTRKLLSKYGIEGNPEHRVFSSLDGIEDYMRAMTDFVVKPDGLTGGKGVKVSGEHLHSLKESVDYCNEIFSSGHQDVIIEEKLDGEEFSLQSFFDGKNVAHTIPVQDHKRAWNDDRGPNTGGMGSYSCGDHLLPFLSEKHIQQARDINRRVGEALLKETGQEYKGILFGGFMITAQGLRVIEYNARFGDPEVMNILPIMRNSFLDVCKAIVTGTLDRLDVSFDSKATVCKYVVPDGYPDRPIIGAEIDISALDQMVNEEQGLRVYYGAAEGNGPVFRLTGSRAIALVGIGQTIDEAESIAERAASLIRGPVYHRSDVGTQKLIQKRKDHMDQLRSYPPSSRLKIAS